MFLVESLPSFSAVCSSTVLLKQKKKGDLTHFFSQSTLILICLWTEIQQKSCRAKKKVLNPSLPKAASVLKGRSLHFTLLEKTQTF